jgi:nicotinamide-nucleotide amidase
MFSTEITTEAKAVLAALRAKGWRCAAAESCTGGLVMGALTAIPGSSDVVDRGFVTYSNEAKTEMLGVDPKTIGMHGAVSDATASEMAQGALTHSYADVAVAITGIAGPGGGNDTKPVGLVWFACATKTNVTWVEQRFGPLSRDEIRELSVLQALRIIHKAAIQTL